MFRLNKNIKTKCGQHTGKALSNHESFSPSQSHETVPLRPVRKFWTHRVVAFYQGEKFHPRLYGLFDMSAHVCSQYVSRAQLVSEPNVVFIFIARFSHQGETRKFYNLFYQLKIYKVNHAEEIDRTLRQLTVYGRTRQISNSGTKYDFGAFTTVLTYIHIYTTCIIYTLYNHSQDTWENCGCSLSACKMHTQSV